MGKVLESTNACRMLTHGNRTMANRRYGSEKVNGALLKALLGRTGIKPEKFAVKAAIGHRTLQKMMAGGSCDLETIEAVAKILEIPPRDLIVKDPIRSKGSVPIIFDTNKKYFKKFPSFTELPLHKIAKQIHMMLEQYEIDLPESSCQAGFYAMLDNAFRIPFVYTGILGNDIDSPYWVFMGIKPSMVEMLNILLKHHEMELDYFLPMGEQLISGEGILPDDDAWDRFANIFDVEVDDLIDRKAVEKYFIGLHTKKN
jgi:hypothetical protein